MTIKTLENNLLIDHLIFFSPFSMAAKAPAEVMIKSYRIAAINILKAVG